MSYPTVIPIQAPVAPRFYRVGDLAKSTRGPGLLGGVCQATLWRWVRLGHFVAPIKLGPNLTVFPADQVDAWIDAKIAEGAK